MTRRLIQTLRLCYLHAVRANPDDDSYLDEWDTIYYCLECLHEEQEAEKKALTEGSEKSDNMPNKEN